MLADILSQIIPNALFRPYRSRALLHTRCGGPLPAEISVLEVPLLAALLFTVDVLIEVLDETPGHRRSASSSGPWAARRKAAGPERPQGCLPTHAGFFKTMPARTGRPQESHLKQLRIE